ncbi:hypothetical protein AVEN_212350-1 [Araneus ventricosus]|uniref:Histone-lysine N-methyltransferase SETMAR n=1 Tax=Araneus ventricosus TaxID=182803 RepID=A0A4Y2KE40_ARAVE|nr:hypothetical protein AVEN_5527-1 [Araneus ventricosus]GBM99713.1 hypothetical protein AVEN_16848-1 [Araneus ventricosus]GBM99750.1 hypothetical protein AVEN_208406-1 [Araneus ventricosus]GBM99761.1 hypothetical protein AVEN_212350-1 [Araneus ventricosus]
METDGASCVVRVGLGEAIRRKCPGMLSNSIILLYDNARPYKNSRIAAKVQVGSLETTPSYNPDLEPSDYFLFLKLKEHLSRTRISSDIDVKTAVDYWLSGQGRGFYRAWLSNRSFFQINA